MNAFQRPYISKKKAGLQGSRLQSLHPRGDRDLSRLLVLFSRIIVFLGALATECPSDEGQALPFLSPEALAPEGTNLGNCRWHSKSMPGSWRGAGTQEEMAWLLNKVTPKLKSKNWQGVNQGEKKGKTVP